MKERAKKLITDQKIKLEEFSVGDHIRKTMQMFIRIMLTLMIFQTFSLEGDA